MTTPKLPTMRINFATDAVPDWVRETIETSLAIEREDARAAGSIGFMTRALVSATLPYKDPNTKVYERKNGDLTLTILAPKGVPYGKYPRLLLSFLVTEAVRTRSNVIPLGDSLGSFLRDTIGVSSTGGVSGTLTRVSGQMQRLFSSLVSVDYETRTATGRRFSFENITLVERGHLSEADLKRFDAIEDAVLAVPQDGEAATPAAHLWERSDDSSSAGTWNSSVELTAKFFEECLNTPVPLDLRAYKTLGGAPMAMDLYAWLTYRMSYIKRPTKPIPWVLLQAQFGSGLPFTEQGLRDFKKAFKRNVELVRIVYPSLRIDETSNAHGVVLLPSPPHIPKSPEQVSAPHKKQVRTIPGKKEQGHLW